MPDTKDLAEFMRMRSGDVGGGGVDKEIVDSMLSEDNLDTKNLFTPTERNMLFLLKRLEDDIPGFDADKTLNDFMRLQLSLEGFNRHSMERMANPIAAPPPQLAPQVAKNV